MRLLNPLVSIYTAGTQVATPTGLFTANDFVTPILTRPIHPNQGDLGAVQQTYFAQYSLAGGDVTLAAGENIERLTRTALGELVPDSSRQTPDKLALPTWLCGPGDGRVWRRRGRHRPDSVVTDPAASTTWWIDFSNFFQGVGALGRRRCLACCRRQCLQRGRGGPDQCPRAAGRAGCVEARRTRRRRRPGPRRQQHRRRHLLRRARRRTARGRRQHRHQQHALAVAKLSHRHHQSEVLAPETWLPTTLFLGKGSFDVSARGDVLLGPTTNPFLLPAGLNNKFWYKSYFSTYAPDSAVRVSALGGDVTLRNEVVLPSETQPARFCKCG